MKSSKRLLVILPIVFVVMLLSAIFATRYFTLKDVGLVSENYLTVIAQPKYIENFNNPFSSFLDDEKAEFIISRCKDFNVNPITVVSILEKENPTLDCKATSEPNDNGTRDLGLFQLNDKSLFGKGGFVDMWWPKDFGEFNPDNWKHSAYLAIKYVQDLQKTFGKNNIFYIAAAYNAGTSRAYNECFNVENAEKLPIRTRVDYAPSVTNNFNKWLNIMSS